MLGSIARIFGQVLEAAGSVVGYRHGTEEPAHSAEKLTNNVEIRRYGARIAAETTVSADEEAARNAGFRRLARYIFGANRGSQKIAMTAPVAQRSGKGEKIAMTAPVAQNPAGKDEWVIRFFMPADKTLESLPVPDDAQVRLVTVPPETIAVRRFSGSRSARAVAAQTAELLETLRDNGFKPMDAPAAWFYDPPWTVPPLRRNEIAVPVEPAG
ncbi:MAG: heme-binding protein [Actinomycetota bacterium]|uniref:Heme-binding protein n=1 Tax=Mycobacterium lentiflavum TaxID=141349 RepID=A0ABY3UWG6_MYCLN|nr:heme-binding protein [Mycobacterium lentiflavum]MEE3062812.1 heme-binding protein [Actinomycetota bacterium]ULP43930.1 heme-binding protein [Mycobacterium lentiflavum]